MFGRSRANPKSQSHTLSISLFLLELLHRPILLALAPDSSSPPHLTARFLLAHFLLTSASHRLLPPSVRCERFVPCVRIIQTPRLDDADMRYLVNSGADLLLVSRYLDVNHDIVNDENVNYRTVGFNVFMMNWMGLRWEKNWPHIQGIQVGLKGEFFKIYTIEENEKAGWAELSVDADPSTFTWYKTYFDSPAGTDPVALNLGIMGKGQAWVNGHHIGRYWTLVAPKDGCQEIYYQEAYNSDKCSTNCGKPTQTWYHIPRSWMQASSNLLVIFEETGGNPFEISINSHAVGIICAQVSESHYPPVQKWFNPDFIDKNGRVNDRTPEIHLHCQDGFIISSIEFSSYGSPQGHCQMFSQGNCHASNSFSIVSEACVGKNNCSIGVSNLVFGGDPCRGIVKTLAIEASCRSLATVGFSEL
ncbi:hypothetical protein ACLB2K_041829 [Fragaria x ananassa]